MASLPLNPKPFLNGLTGELNLRCCFSTFVTEEKRQEKFMSCDNDEFLSTGYIRFFIYIRRIYSISLLMAMSATMIVFVLN